MGFSVSVSGRLRMTKDRETEAFAILSDALWPEEVLDGSVSALGDLTWTATITREGDWLRFAPDFDGDPKWSDEENAFYGALGRWAEEGRIDVEGEDGGRWSYLYSGGQVIQDGTNGWDGTTTPTPFGDD